MDTCFFCDQKVNTSSQLRHAATKHLHAKVHQCAKTLQDTKLLAKMADKDLTAQDAAYHLTCLNKYYRKAAAALQGQQSTHAASDESEVAL